MPLPSTSVRQLQQSSRSSLLPRQRHLPVRARWSRSAATYASPIDRLREQVTDAWTQYPVLFPFMFIASFASASLLGLLIYDRIMRVDPEYAAYPPNVQEQLRIALHFTHVQPDPGTASKAFLRAIREADLCGMDPFGKESIGIRIRFSEMLENFGQVKTAIEVLNGITRDCEAKLSEIDEDSPSKIVASNAATGKATPNPNARKALIRLIIQTKAKAAALYEGDYMQDPLMAKNILSDAVALLVKETKDPQVNGFSEDNAAGFSMAEIASILSQMGDLYATSGEEANAVQVYMLTLQPLRAACNGTRSCKEVQVLSNIASTMTLALKKPNAKINGKPVTKETLAAGRRATLKWAEQAIATADVVKPENRDEICELGLLSAQMTRADLLLDTGAKAESKEAFNSIIPTLKEKGLSNLVLVAEQSVRRANS